MNEENSNLTAQNPEEWQAPPQDLKPLQEPPQMSEAATLGSIFFEPGRTFARFYQAVPLQLFSILHRQLC